MKIGDVLTEFKTAPQNDKPYEILTLTEKNGFIKQSDRFNKKLATDDISKYKVIKKGEIAFNPYLLWAGAIALNTKFKEGIISPLYPTFKVESSIDAFYLFSILLSPQMIRKFDQISFGSVPRKRRSTVRDFLQLTLPPFPNLGEQKRIAEILERVNYSIESINNQIQFVESLPKQIFELFFNEESRQEERQYSTISSFISSTQYGTSKKASDSGSTPILRMGNITYSGQVDMSDLKYINLEDKEIDKYTLQDGDLLFNRTNSVELVGKTAVFEEKLDQKISYAGYLIRAKTNPDSNPYYICGYLNSPDGKAQLRLRAKAIVGMANINAKEFLSLKIPAATKSEQDNFAYFYLRCESARKILAKKLVLLQELQRSLSTRAFAGEL